MIIRNYDDLDLLTDEDRDAAEAGHIPECECGEKDGVETYGCGELCDYCAYHRGLRYRCVRPGCQVTHRARGVRCKPDCTPDALPMLPDTEVTI